MNFTLGLPNGSMQNPMLQLMSKVGIDIHTNGRSGLAQISDDGFVKQAIFMRPQDMANALLQNQIDCGICGLDWLLEAELEHNLFPNKTIKRLCELPLSRKRKQSARIVLFGRKDGPSPQATTTTISSEYPNMTRRHYPNADIAFSHGSTEVKVALGQFDYGVCLTETGSSLRDNNLHIIDELLVTPTVFIARVETPELIAFGDLLLGALKAEDHHLIKLNLGRQYLQAVLQFLPALRAPTITPLSDQAFAIETVVPRNKTASLLIELRTQGATDIVVQNMNAIVS